MQSFKLKPSTYISNVECVYWSNTAIFIGIIYFLLKVPYVENALYSASKYSCVRPVQ